MTPPRSPRCPQVRAALLERQRRLCRAPRDWWPTGATWARWYFPDAQVKIFLTASPEERALQAS